VGVAVLREGDVLAGVAFIGAGVAGIGYGVVVLRRTGSFAHILTWLASLTTDPTSKALHHDNPARSGPDHPPPGPSQSDAQQP
ncbi:MAG: hypothetical protein M3460_26155, partial [Actinomycetota bacterium]|nr:hypothetical protein [Actinomycetota bacterium]